MDADAERLLAEFGPTEEEASFIRQQGRIIFAMVLKAYREHKGANIRPMTVEMAIAYPSVMASAWARQIEHDQKAHCV